MLVVAAVPLDELLAEALVEAGAEAVLELLLELLHAVTRMAVTARLAATTCTRLTRVNFIKTPL
jgi:hypothetical protein